MNDLYKSFLLVTFLIPSLSHSNISNEDAIFFDKYVDEEMYIDNSFEYEYICAKPIITNDCRTFSVDILKPPFPDKFSITNLLKKEDISFFELLIGEQIYYIQAKRLMNGINITNFRTEPLPVVNEAKIEEPESNNDLISEEIIDSYIGQTVTLDGDFYICNDKIKKLDCDSENVLNNPSITIIKNMTNRSENIIYEVSYLNQDNKKFIYWINDYIIDMFKK